MNRRQAFRSGAAGMLLVLAFHVRAADWPMRGRDNSRNAASVEKGAPIDWQIDVDGGGKKQISHNIKWSAKLGSFSLGAPVIADGLVWVGTNNDEPRDPKSAQDASVLMCFRERDGEFLYQYVSPRMTEGKRYDWENSGLASSPLVEGDRLWFCNNRYEVICLDISQLHSGKGKVKTLWKLDMHNQLGVEPRAVMIPSDAIHCSLASNGDFIYVNTLNARDYKQDIPAPNAPSLVCFEKQTGGIVWQDSSPGKNILDVQQGNPLAAEIAGRAQVIIGQGDGWLRSFDARSGKLLWKFDINLKDPHEAPSSGHTLRREDANYFIATPVLYENRIYIASGRHSEQGDGPGRLCCIDPTRSGDVSSEVVDLNGKGRPNSNSALIWEYRGAGNNGMRRSLSTVAIQDNLLIALDQRGLIHCLDAQTGKEHWTHDAKARIFSSPLIVDGKVYVGDEDGDLLILSLSANKKLLATHSFNEMIYASPVFANGVLYVMNFTHLYAIKQ